MHELTPREIVAELDRHIVGQAAAKRAVAIAMRNRWRRQQLAPELRPEISPKNILMIGPTGVGKTEIARRLAKLTGAPFIKVEATKYTEVGYYGRDVESLIRDLMEHAIKLVTEQERATVHEQAHTRVEERLLDLLSPPPIQYEAENDEKSDEDKRYERTREKMRAKLKAGDFEERKVELQVDQKMPPMMIGSIGPESNDMDLQGMFEKFLPKQSTRREHTVADARKILFDQECEALVNDEKVQQRALDITENLGIVFLDEIDKIVAGESRGPDVSRQGVQRDLLPIVEGTTVKTKYGFVKTDHILFIAAGAFHTTKPSDLMPELQGRFPIRVELTDLTKDDFVRILTEPKSALTKQYAALLGTEKLDIKFTKDAVEALAEHAFRVNQTTQNIGARRLYTILERLLEELSFSAPERSGEKIKIDAKFVNERLEPITQNEDLSRYIL
jgi:ATP-dependent HslUV protease ATP-binding subunit HslU